MIPILFKVEDPRSAVVESEQWKVCLNVHEFLISVMKPISVNLLLRLWSEEVDKLIVLALALFFVSDWSIHHLFLIQLVL